MAVMESKKGGEGGRVTETLTQDFRAVAPAARRAPSLRSLRRAFVAAAGVEETAALQALSQFERAARRLQDSEKVFRARARQPGSLLSHLRSPEQMAALRGFAQARENLLTLHPGLGQDIVDRTAENLSETTPTRPHRTAAAFNL